MAERTRLEAILGYVILQQVVIYPFAMCWAWNLKGGWLSDMGFFDRGASMVLFGSASIGGLAGAIVVGPRYFIGISRQDRVRIQEGVAKVDDAPQKIKALVELIKKEQLTADELTLRKLRKLVKFNNLD